jgi:hypothetical protein
MLRRQAKRRGRRRGWDFHGCGHEWRRSVVAGLSASALAGNGRSSFQQGRQSSASSGVSLNIHCLPLGGLGSAPGIPTFPPFSREMGELAQPLGRVNVAKAAQIRASVGREASRTRITCRGPNSHRVRHRLATDTRALRIP